MSITLIILLGILVVLGFWIKSYLEAPLVPAPIAVNDGEDPAALEPVESGELVLPEIRLPVLSYGGDCVQFLNAPTQKSLPQWSWQKHLSQDSVTHH